MDRVEGGGKRMRQARVASAGTLTLEGETDPLEDERARLAYAIHDGLTQVVTAAVLELDWLAGRVETSPEEAAEGLRTAAASLRGSLEEIRGVLSTLSGDGRAAATSIEELVRDVTARWHLPAAWSVEGDLDRIPVAVMDAASSVIREGFVNAAKHAEPAQVQVRVRANSDVLEVRVRDDGRGFRTGVSGDGGHLGLEMMRRRVAKVRGTLDVRSSPGHGTTLVARLPMSDGGVRA